MTIPEQIAELKQRLDSIDAQLVSLTRLSIQAAQTRVTATTALEMVRESDARLWPWFVEGAKRNAELRDVLIAIAKERGVAL